MKKSTLQLEQLEWLLNLWTNENLISRARGHIFGRKANDGHISDSQIRDIAMIEENSIFINPIKGYNKFAEIVMNNKICKNPFEYLKEPSKKVKTYITHREDRLRAAQIDSIPIIPYVLGMWTQTRKVISIENLSLIEPIDPEKEFWFDCPLYPSFVLHIPEKIEFESKIQKVSCSTAIITMGEKAISVMLINDLAKDFILTLEEKHGISRLLENKPESKKTGKKLESYWQRYISKKEALMNNQFSPPIFHFFVRNTKEKQVQNERSESEKQIAKQIEEVGNEAYKNGDIFSIDQMKAFICILNGLFKKMIENSMYAKKKVDHSEERNLEELLGKPKPKWWEIEITKIEHVDFQLDEQKTINKHCGFEMTPHIRIGHWRTLIKKDGTITKTWIESTIVRQDKLNEDESISQSATLIKK